MPAICHTPDEDGNYTDEQLYAHLLHSDCSECVRAGSRFNELKSQATTQPKFGVAGVFCDGDHVLLQHRKKEPGHGFMVLPGGGVESGETPFDAFLRETREELGIDLGRFASLTITPVWFEHVNGVIMLYYAMDFSVFRGQEDNAEPNKCYGLHWLNRHGLSASMWESDRRAVQAAYRLFSARLLGSGTGT